MARSSLLSAAFRIVQGSDGRGLALGRRKDIMTLRRLRQDPLPAAAPRSPRGRLRTQRELKR